MTDTMQEIERLVDDLQGVCWDHQMRITVARTALLDAIRRVVEDAERYRMSQTENKAAERREPDTARSGGTT